MWGWCLHPLGSVPAFDSTACPFSDGPVSVDWRFRLTWTILPWAVSPAALAPNCGMSGFTDTSPTFCGLVVRRQSFRRGIEVKTTRPAIPRSDKSIPKQVSPVAGIGNEPVRPVRKRYPRLMAAVGVGVRLAADGEGDGEKSSLDRSGTNRESTYEAPCDATASAGKHAADSILPPAWLPVHISFFLYRPILETFDPAAVFLAVHV